MSLPCVQYERPNVVKTLSRRKSEVTDATAMRLAIAE